MSLAVTGLIGLEDFNAQGVLRCLEAGELAIAMALSRSDGDAR